MQVVNKLTGEIYEIKDNTPTAIKDSWLLLSETIKACERAKDKLKLKIDEMLDDKGQYDYGDYLFRQFSVQRMSYDKSVMREVLDADLFDTLLVPDKTAIDTYLKENIDTTGDVGTTLRKTMVAVGKPYSTLRLERVKHDN